MTYKTINIVLCFTAIFIGGFLYLIFRPNTYITQIIFDLININGENIRTSAVSCAFSKYYLPDFLWAFSLCCGLVSVFPHKRFYIILVGIITFLCGLIWELLQFTKTISGTGDILDIILYLTACLIAVMINIKISGEKNEKT